VSAATKVTCKKKKTFLAHLAKHGNVTAAAVAAGMPRMRVYNLREKDPEFKACWEDAVEKATDLLILELQRRAWKGTRKPVFHKGVVVGHIREYSDVLGMFLVKAKRPEYADYRERRTETTVNPQSDGSVKIVSEETINLVREQIYGA